MRHSLIFGKKVVLGFESEFSISRARDWVRSYNQKSVFPLSVFNELPILFFVIQFSSEDLPAAKRSLLASSPLGAGEIYASVNDYTISFDPCNQSDFRHLVTVHIPRGNPVIFSLMTLIINVVGTYAKGVLGSDNRHISVVAPETTLKLFPAYGHFQLLNTEVTTIF